MALVDMTPTKQVFDASIHPSGHTKAIDFIRKNRDYSSSLDSYLNSETGRATLTELRRLQALIPQNHRWQITPSDEDKKDPEKMAHIRESNEMRARINPQKLRIHFRYDDSPAGNPLSPPPKYVTGYDQELHTLYISVPHILQTTVVKRDGTTNQKVLATFALGELLNGGIETVNLHLREQFEKGPKLTVACKAEKVLNAERAYTQEFNKSASNAAKLPVRELSNDPEYLLQMRLGKVGQNTWWDKFNKFMFGDSLRRYNTSEIVPLTESLAPRLVIDAGCKQPSVEELLARTRKLFQDNAVNSKGVSDAQMKNAIDRALRAAKLGQYDPAYSR